MDGVRWKKFERSNSKEATHSVLMKGTPRFAEEVRTDNMLLPRLVSCEIIPSALIESFAIVCLDPCSSPPS